MDNEEPIKKDTTKEKIILFVIGVLTGAVISTGAFFAYIKLAGVGANNTSNTNQSNQMPGGTPPEMPSGDQGNTPPEMPSNTDGSSSTPPEMPSDGSNSQDTQNSQDSQNSANGQSNNTAPTKPNKNKSNNS